MKRVANRHKLNFIEPICVECGGMGKMTTGSVLHPDKPQHHGKMFFACVCGAWSGCHPGTGIPVGKPALGPTRYLRGKAHIAFDALWIGERTGTGVATGYARSRAYKWLARELGKKPEDTHIGWMNAAECRRVIEICKQQAQSRKAA